MGPLIGALLTAGAGLVSDAMGRAADREQNEYNSPAQVRARAEAAGFNPLLFVGAGVGQQTSHYVPQFGRAVADAVSVYEQANADYERLKLEQTRLAQEQQRLQKIAQRSALSAEVGGDGLGPMAVHVPLPDNARPTARPTALSGGLIPVFDVGGSPISIPRKIADRLGIHAWDSLTADDYSMLLGDELSQMFLATKIPQITNYVYGGMFGGHDSEAERLQAAEHPWSLRNFFGLAPRVDPEPVSTLSVDDNGDISVEEFVKQFSSAYIHY